MAKHLGTQLLRPARHLGRKETRPLPQSTLLVRKPIHPGPSLGQAKTQNLATVDHGQHIYVYNNIATNQVVYSLTRHLDNKKAIEQLPYLGKKTVPARLRKDMWTPFCLASFPSTPAGLAAYHKLREFRRLHETYYDRDIITEKEGPHTGQLMPRKKRAKVLMNQKANTVADLAAVLFQQEKGPTEKRKHLAETRMKRAEELKAQKGEENVKKAPVDVESTMTGVDGVSIRWANPADAEYAETWPKGVVHGDLERSRYTVAFPIVGEDVHSLPEVTFKDIRENVSSLVSAGAGDSVGQVPHATV